MPRVELQIQFRENEEATQRGARRDGEQKTRCLPERGERRTKQGDLLALRRQIAEILKDLT
jgi:hypothetical protein